MPVKAEDKALLSSKWPHWTTPSLVLERVRAVGPIALDPCSNLASRTGARRELWGTEAHHRDEAVRAYEAFCKDREERPTDEGRAQVSARAANELGGAAVAAGAMGRHVELADGLAESWQGCDSVIYCNPPYGRALPAWLRKVADEGAAGAEVIILVPSRTDTAAMHDHVFKRAQAACFWRGRLQFANPPTDSKSPGSTFPSFIGYYGPRRDRFFEAFEGAGELVGLSEVRK